MDIIDKVTYNFEWDNEKDLAEHTRRAFVEVFNPERVANWTALYIRQEACGTTRRRQSDEFSDQFLLLF